VERPSRPAKARPGWKTVHNPRVGFTLSVPRGWHVTRRRGATLIRSPDRLLALTVAADRTVAGRETPARGYARETLSGIPGFRRKLQARAARAVRGSPYDAVVASARGTFAATRRPQLIDSAALRRARLVTYSVIAFRNARVAPRR